MPGTALQRLRDNDPTLTKVDLTKSSVFSMKVAEYTTSFAEVLKTNTHLKELILANCGIITSGAIEFAEALKVNSTLTRLDLANNRIAGEGAIAIAEALKENSTLLELKLLGQNVKFGENVMSAFVDMFEHNTTLLNIIWRIDSRQSFTINKKLSRNKEIERRILADMDWDDLNPAKRRLASAGCSPQPSRATSLTPASAASPAPASASAAASTPAAEAPAVDPNVFELGGVNYKVTPEQKHFFQRWQGKLDYILWNDFTKEAADAFNLVRA